MCVIFSVCCDRNEWKWRRKVFHQLFLLFHAEIRNDENVAIKVDEPPPLFSSLLHNVIISSFSTQLNLFVSTICKFCRLLLLHKNSFKLSCGVWKMQEKLLGFFRLFRKRIKKLFKVFLLDLIQKNFKSFGIFLWAMTMRNWENWLEKKKKFPSFPNEWAKWSVKGSQQVFRFAKD